VKWFTPVSVMMAGLLFAGDALANRDRLRGIQAVSTSIYDTLDTMWPDELVVPGLRAQIGLGLGFSPEFTGSDDYDIKLVPIFRLQYKTYATLTGNTLRGHIHHSDNMRAGILVKYVFSRSENKNLVLEGLGTISNTIAFGPYVEYRMDPLRLMAELRHGTGAGYGTEAEFTVFMGFIDGERLSAQTSVSTTWSSSKHMQTHFGITDEQAENSFFGLPAYEAGSGISQVAWSVSSRYRITDRLSAVGFLEYARLFGDAKNSPLVEYGSPNQFSGGTGLMFAF